MTDLDTRLQTMFTRTAEAEGVPPLPDFRALLDSGTDAPERAHPRRARRRVLAAAAALAIVGGGLSIAAAAGLTVVPSALSSALGWTPEPGAINAYPQTARVVLTEPGPDGETLRLWYADATDDSYCVALTADADGAGAVEDPAARSRDGVGAGGCGGTVGDRYWNTFGGQSFSAFGPGSPTTFIMRATGAATVELQFDDGTHESLPVGDGFTSGWVLARDKALHPVVVGYAADGSEVGRVPIDY